MNTLKKGCAHQAHSLLLNCQFYLTGGFNSADTTKMLY